MPDALVKGSNSDLASKLEPTVNTLARPSKDVLLQARADIQRDATLRDLFREAREQGHPESWLADNLTARLAGLWGNLPEALEASEYLAAEYTQLGEGIMLVSSVTGKVIAKLEESDLYQPAPVLRESGTVATPLTRIEPNLEASLVSWVFEKGREERITAVLAERAHQTALLREEGDRRLWVASRSGRARMARALADDHPKTLLEATDGSSGAFLRLWDVVLEPPSWEPAWKADFTLEATTTLNILDPLTTNLQYDRLGVMRGVVGQAWARSLGLQLARAMHRLLPVTSGTLTGGLYLADPDVLATLRTKAPKVPIPGCPTLGVKGSKLGALLVAEESQLRSQEVFGKWEVTATLQVTALLRSTDGVFEPIETQDLSPHTEVVR